MATWEDGPEYAPVRPPSEYAEPQTAPLAVAPPVVDLAAGAPIDQPRFDQPAVPVAPLATLIPPLVDVRDPHLPFDVAASTATEESSAWSAAHYAAPAADAGGWPAPSTPFGQPAANGWPAPTRSAAGLPTAPIVPQQSAPAPGPYAAANSPQWFAPPPPGYAPQGPPPLTAARLWNAASPGALICLLVGGLVFPLSVITICVALGLSTRLTVARAWVMRSYGIAITLLSFIGAIALLVGRYDFAEWWLLVGRWGQFVSFALIASTLVIVAQTLRGRLVDRGRRPGTWG